MALPERSILSRSHAGRPLWVLLLVLWTALPAGVQTDTELHLPLTVPYALLSEMTWQPPAGEGPAEYADGPCRRLRIAGSRLELRDGGLYLVSRAEAALGVSLLGNCIEPIDWRGSVDARLDPYLDDTWQLRFRLGDIELRDPRGEPESLLNLVGDLARPFISRRVETFAFDLRAPREQVAELLSEAVEPEDLSEVQAVLAGLRPGTPHVDAGGIRLEARLTLPAGLADRLLPLREADPANAAGGDLTRRLERLDAFLVAVVKRLGREVSDTALRRQLTDLLLDSRYRLVEILGTSEAFEQDPVRALFVENWERLRALMQSIEAGAARHSQLLRYAAFVNAGDTLLALDAALPQLGLWISLNGLHAALRELAPWSARETLEYGYAVDPTLRELLGLPPEPPLLPDTGVDQPGESDDEPDLEGDESGGTEIPERPALVWARLLQALIPNAEAAKAEPDRVSELQRALGRRIPRPAELADYGGLIAELLGEIQRQELAMRDLAEAHAEVYADLLPAAALIESCWRQFKPEDGKATYLVSSAGAVGMMQINLRVWRGLYDAERLKWEVAYNARAGAQILLRYLEGPGLDLVKRTGKPEHLARATYAAYNAGPGRAGRFVGKGGQLKPGPVDRKLWSYYQGFAGGGVADLERCTVIGGTEAPPAS